MPHRISLTHEPCKVTFVLYYCWLLFLTKSNITWNHTFLYLLNFSFWCLYFLLYLLLVSHLNIKAVGVSLDKFVMISRFDQPSFVYDKDLVAGENGGHSVSNYYLSYLSWLINIMDCFLNFKFVLVVERRGSLVKNKQFWVLYKRSCDGESLFLSSWKFAP
mgnify:CR=1 FL=1